MLGVPLVPTPSPALLLSGFAACNHPQNLQARNDLDLQCLPLNLKAITRHKFLFGFALLTILAKAVAKPVCSTIAWSPLAWRRHLVKPTFYFFPHQGIIFKPAQNQAAHGFIIDPNFVV